MSETPEEIAADWALFDLEAKARATVSAVWLDAYLKAKRTGCDIMWAHHEADRAVERFTRRKRAAADARGEEQGR